MSNFEIHGVDELKRALNERISLDDVKKVVQQNGAELQQKMVRNASFSKGYQTGTTKRSISIALKDSGLTAVVAPGTNYSPYLEYGTRFMSAQPFVGPSFNAQKNQFKSDMKRLVK